MNILKKMALAASLFFVSGFASAAVYDFGSFNSSGKVYESEIVNLAGTGNFFDKFDFTLEEALMVDLSTVKDGAFMFFTTILNDATGSEVAGGVTTGSGTAYASLVAGDYTAYVVGFMTSPLGSYQFSVSAAPISPIPEASTIAMMLGGLGLVGFMARRRKAA